MIRRIKVFPPASLPTPVGGIRRAVFIVSILTLLLLAGKNASADTLKLGVHPYLSYSEVQVRFRPLVRYLEKYLNTKVLLRIGRDYAEHLEHIGEDKVDIAYLGPVSYVQMAERFGKKPLLARLERNGRAFLDGHIVASKRSSIRNIEDLRGRSFGFGDPNSTMSSVVPMAVMKKAGIELEQLAHHARYRGQTNIAIAVLSGQIDAGAVKSEVYERFAGQGLRSILKLPEVSEHLFVTRSGLPQETIDTIRELLLHAAKSPEGEFALKSLHPKATGLVEVSDRDYDSLREILRSRTE